MKSSRSRYNTCHIAFFKILFVIFLCWISCEAMMFSTRKSPFLQQARVKKLSKLWNMPSLAQQPKHATVARKASHKTEHHQAVRPDSPVVVNVYIDQEILRFMHMSNRDRKGRFLLSSKWLGVKLPVANPNDPAGSGMESSSGKQKGQHNPTSTIGCYYNLKLIRNRIENKFPPLANKDYKLRYRLACNASKAARQFGELKGGIDSDSNSSRGDRADDDVHFAVQQAALSGSSLQLFVQVNQGVFPPPPPSSPLSDNAEGTVLLSMLAQAGAAALEADPVDAATYTMLSFYTFAPVADPHALAANLQYFWAPFQAHGRVYVAKEGVNAQMAVPTNVLRQFRLATLSAVPALTGARFNADPQLVDRAEYDAVKPFKGLHIRVRDCIVADSRPSKSRDSSSGAVEVSSKDRHGTILSAPSSRGVVSLELQEPGAAGQEMPPQDWHAHLKRGTDAQGRPIVVLDCRNSYESQVGAFEGAIPLNTTSFRESWTALEELLRDVQDKDTPILTYCTGGIRCVKVNAYLRQKMGFQNTHRLQGGIIAYTRELLNGAQGTDGTAAVSASCTTTEADVFEEFRPRTWTGGVASTPSPSSTSPTQAAPLPSQEMPQQPKSSLFRGVNYVFDERIGSRVTADVLSQCDQCGAPCDAYRNCPNHGCNVRLLQCRVCSEQYSGCCCQICQKEHQLRGVQQLKQKKLNRQGHRSAMLDRRTLKALRRQEHEEDSLLSNNSGTTGTFKEQADSTGTLKEQTGSTGALVRQEVLSRHALCGHIAPTATSGQGKEGEGGTPPPTRRDTRVDLAKPLGAGTEAAGIGAVEGAGIGLAEALAEYCERLSASEPALLTQLRRETEACHSRSSGAARMLCDPLQGRLLALLAEVSGARRVLELGTFTGYSALCLAAGLDPHVLDTQISTGPPADAAAPGPPAMRCRDAGNLGDRPERNETRATASATGKEQRVVVTCEIDDAAADVAEKYFTHVNTAESGLQIKLRRASAGQLIAELKTEIEARTQHDCTVLPCDAAKEFPQMQFDMVFLDADKKQYGLYLLQLMGYGAVAAAAEQLRLLPPTDSSKGGSGSAANSEFSPPQGLPLLADGAIVVVDNTLWKGLVLEHAEGLAQWTPPPSSFGNARRMRALAAAMHDFNLLAQRHPYLQPVLLPLRDGLSVVRYTRPQPRTP